MRLATACLLVLAVLAAGVPAATAKQRARPLSACVKLAKRDKDRAPDRKLVLVVRGDDEVGRIAGCVLPRGKVRTLAYWEDSFMRAGARIVATAGTRVLVESSYGDQYGGVSRSLTRIDVREGRRLLLTGYNCLLEYMQQHCPQGTTFGKAAIAPSGAGAFELVDYAAATTTLRAFSPRGSFATLAVGAVQALGVTSTQVVWTQGGVEHAAPLLP